MNTVPATAGTPRKKLLLVEDDPGTAEIVTAALSNAGYDITWFDHADDPILFFQPSVYDVAILDVKLPGERDGFDVCRHIRTQDPNIAVLFLTVVSEEVERIVGLEIGADDYIVKPFSSRELVARVKTILRRTRVTQPPVPATRLTFGELSIDIEWRKLEVRGAKVELTATEFNLLAFLAANPGRAFTRAQLIKNVWGYDSEGYEESVTVLIQRLRGSIEANPKEPQFILTVRGIGYRFCEAGELP